MPRRLTIESTEMGAIDLYLIYAENGTWEEQWRPLQGALDLPSVTKEVMDHALQSWTRPLVGSLGPLPKGMLHKLPKASRYCAYEKSCIFYERRRCGIFCSKMPWCFEPAEIFPGNLAAEVVKLWRQGVYIVVVYD